MLHEQIKALRKAKGMSQEELAVQLHVVRQTVSKWENGLSVPDADVVLRIAEVLGVSVNQLLELPADSQDGLNLAEELAKANQQLAEHARRETLQRQVGRKRGWILFLSFWALLLALLIRQEIVSLLLTGACLLAAAILLYRNLPLLTSETAEGGNHESPAPDHPVQHRHVCGRRGICPFDRLGCGDVFRIRREDVCHGRRILRDALCRNRGAEAALQQTHWSPPAVDGIGRGDLVSRPQDSRRDFSSRYPAVYRLFFDRLLL